MSKNKVLVKIFVSFAIDGYLHSRYRNVKQLKELILCICILSNRPQAYAVWYVSRLSYRKRSVLNNLLDRIGWGGEGSGRGCSENVKCKSYFRDDTCSVLLLTGVALTATSEQPATAQHMRLIHSLSL
jgi:hypothetical protein